MGLFRLKKTLIFFSFTLSVLFLYPPSLKAIPEEHLPLSRYTVYEEPEFLNFEELQTLARNPEPGGALEKKLEAFWQTPIISNEAYYRGARPRILESPELGNFLRVASWNIEKSLNINDAVRVFTLDENFPLLIAPDKIANESARSQIESQQQKLATADIILLQEMDIGVKRSGYVNTVRLLGEKLNMNYAYGPQQLEIDPVTLGLEKIKYEEGDQDTEATNYYAADPEKYKGVFGIAVLSRYPIRSAQVFQLKNQPYDWYHKEKAKTTYLEKARRHGTRLLFLNEITREMKVGGRIFLRVDLDVPELPGGVLSIIHVHLEIKCQPKGRELQMREILSHIRGIRNPVIVAGDFNSAPTDISPTSVTRVVKRTLKNPTTWLSLGVNLLTPHALAVNTSRATSNITKNFQDPTARHIGIVAPNPTHSMFQMIQDFRFEDGSAFDFRGDKKRSMHGKKGTLSNSNQRDFKGYVTTFQLRRPIAGIIGKYKLDWFFVKSNYLKGPDPKNASYRFAPHFGETLEELNTGLSDAISDHHPIVIDLPLQEPPLKNR